MPLPPDRGAVATEQRSSASELFDTLDVRGCVDLLIEDQGQTMGAVRGASAALTAFIDALVPRVADGGRLIYVGCGTSGRLGVLDAAECPPTFQADASMIVGVIAGGDRSLRTSSEAAEDDPAGSAEELELLRVGPADTLLGIAAGGTTPWVLGACSMAADRGAMTALLTSAPPDGVRVDHVIHLATGAEVLAGSTRLKAATATKIALNIITTTLFTRLGKVYGNLMVDLNATNAKLKDRAIRIVVELCDLDRAAAADALEAAGGDLKLAVVMQRCCIDADAAAARLDAAGGFLRAALGE